MPGDLLDLVLLAAVVAFAISGYRQGFVIGALSFAGFLGGGALGARFAPTIASHYFTGSNPALIGIVVVFLAAFLGQVLASSVAVLLRRRLVWRPAQVVDSVGGAAISVVSVLLVAWLLATAVAHSSLTALGRQVRRSVVLTTIDDVMPDNARVWFSSFRRLLDNYGFPQVFGGLGPEPVVPVGQPDPAVVADPGVRVAARSIVKITGDAPSCNRRLEGSGFVFAPQRVLTNAHVVAGVRHVTVQAGDLGSLMAATVVEYDPHRDIAVLYVPGLDRAPLRFAGAAPAGTDAVVAGYPEDGPFRALAARVRGVQRARGPDIYQSAQVTRQIYALRATVRPGNSGGPLLATDGRVYGVVFAAAVDDPETGYALTAGEVAPDVRAGAAASAPVGTATCD